MVLPRARRMLPSLRLAYLGTSGWIISLAFNVCISFAYELALPLLLSLLLLLIDKDQDTLHLVPIVFAV